MRATSTVRYFKKPAYGRLNGDRGDGWCTKEAQRTDDWLQVDLGNKFELCGVATQGSRGNTTKTWVTDFTLSYSSTGGNYQTYNDANGVKVVRFYFICRKVIADTIKEGGAGGWGVVLPYVSYTGTCRGIMYGFRGAPVLNYNFW